MLAGHNQRRFAVNLSTVSVVKVQKNNMQDVLFTNRYDLIQSRCVFWLMKKWVSEIPPPL